MLNTLRHEVLVWLREQRCGHLQRVEDPLHWTSWLLPREQMQLDGAHREAVQGELLAEGDGVEATD